MKEVVHGTGSGCLLDEGLPGQEEVAQVGLQGPVVAAGGPGDLLGSKRPPLLTGLLKLPVGEPLLVLHQASSGREKRLWRLSFQGLLPKKL